jgi:hypothetical protein
MKIKLIKDQLSSANAHQGLRVSDWLKLNNGGSIEVDSIPELIKDKVKEIKQKPKEQKDGN